MKVEVDMEKISAEIAAAEEAARKRMADREKDAGGRSAREAPACVLAEEEKHICATHGNKSQQPPLADGGNKQCENTESNSAGAPGEPVTPADVTLLDPNASLSFDRLVFFSFREDKALGGPGGASGQRGGGVGGQGERPGGRPGGGDQRQQHGLGDHLRADGGRAGQRAVRGALQSQSGPLRASNDPRGAPESSFEDTCCTESSQYVEAFVERLARLVYEPGNRRAEKQKRKKNKKEEKHHPIKQRSTVAAVVRHNNPVLKTSLYPPMEEPLQACTDTYLTAAGCPDHGVHPDTRRHL